MPNAEDWQACYRPDLCYSFLRLLKMTVTCSPGPQLMQEIERGDGMVAVVRGLGDAGLTVTLLEGCRRYTLMPNSVPHPPMPSLVHETRDVPESVPAATEVCPERCDSSSQATDGRYASTYKMAHCNVRPTSPPVELTEFSPQRAELCPGHGNFEVGGTGSGEKYSSVRPTTQFRGGMSWPDRGSVCAPRTLQELDPFANSLRKYSNMSPQRSSEIVERLVNYTQARHASKISARSRLSPTRLSECNSNHTLDRESRVPLTRPRCCEPETMRPRVKTDESPTREGRPKRCDIFPEMNGTAFGRNFEVRYLREHSKRTRDSLRNLDEQPNYQPSVLDGLLKYDFCLDGPQILSLKKGTGSPTASVNMEIQAVVEMTSREVATLPRVELSKRSVAIPLSPISSITQHSPEAPVAGCLTSSAFKSVQTIQTNIATKTPKSIQATSSSIELLTVVDRSQCNERRRRKSKSQEDLRTRKDDFRKEMLLLLENIDCHDDEVCQAFRDELVRKIKKNRRRISLGIDKRAKSTPFWFKAKYIHCTENCRRVNKLNFCRAEAQNITVSNQDNLLNTVRDWVQEIYVQNADCIERHSLDKVVSSLASKLRHLCLNSEKLTKSEIKQMIEEVTFDASDSDRNVQLNNLADALTSKIKDVLHSSTKKLILCKPREGNTNTKKSTCFPFKKLMQPTQEEVRSFVREELLVFMNKFHLKFNSKSICDVETELTDILMDSIKELQWDDNHKVKDEVIIVLQETSKMPNHYFTCLGDALVKRFKSFIRAFNSLNKETIRQQTFVVLQNTVQNTSGQPTGITNTSIEPVTEADIEAHIERYTSQLTQVIGEWWTSILGAYENEKGFKEVAINDLAGDIVDRHRYLDMNTSKRSSDEDEVEYLKFQIFRWINKLVGEEAMQQALDQAPKLMEAIQRVPVPIMRIPEGLVRSQNIAERPRSPAPTQSGTPDRALQGKSGYNVNQLPTLGSAGRSNINISESSRIREVAGRRMSEPTAYSMSNAVNAKEVQMSDSPGQRGSSRLPQGRRYSFPENIVSPTENRYTAEPPITDDFERCLYDWVNQIPIVAQEQGLTEKLRRGIFNGVLKALAKAEIDSATSRNDFYINAFLKDEFEELLSCLPSSPELASKKTLLIEKLIERATQRTKAISVANASTSYRHRLWDAITSTLPPRPIVADSDKSNAHLFEEFLKLNIVEDYLLYKLYNEMNLPKANAHREKVLISLQQLYENAKMLPGSSHINSVDAHNFADNIYKAIIKVNVPARNVIRDEGDQIIIAHEISQWLQELPIDHSYEYLDQLQRRILRDSLAKKIHEIEKQTNFCDDSSVRQVKNELSKFIEKFSPRPEEAGNISFMIDEFIKKLKNRRETVQEPVAFPWFFMNVPFSSSFVENGSPINLVECLDDDWGNLGQPGAAPMVGAEPIPEALSYKEPNNEQWLTMLNTQEQLQRQRDAQAVATPSQQLPSCCQPDAIPSMRSQAMSDNFGHNEQTPYREPSNVEWLTLVNTQEQIERDKKALEAHAQLQQIPPCCQPAVTISQKLYSGMGSGVAYDAVPSTNARGFHTSQVAGASYHPLVSAGRQVGVPVSVPSMQSEMKRLVDLQDQRLSMIHSAIPTTRPGPIDFASFVQPPVHQQPNIPSGSGVLGTSQMPGSSGVARSKLVGPNDPCSGGTPMMQRSVRPRQIRYPQQVMSSGAPINQSQLHFAAPLGQQEAVFTTRHDHEEIPEQNISRPIMSPMDFSIQAPVGFSTPRQSLAGRDGAPEVANAENIPGSPRARRKRTREGDPMRPELARRRLDFEEVEEEEERERDEVQCRCTERVYRCRRHRPMCCDCEEMDYSRYYPMPYPYCFF